MATAQEFLTNLTQGSNVMDQSITDYASQYNIPVNYNPDNNRLLVNGIPVDLGAAGLTAQNGQLYGTQQQYLSVLNPAYQNKYANDQQQIANQMMGQQGYQSPEFIKQFIQQMTARQQQPFIFDASTDPGVQSAKAQLMDSVSEMAGKRGFLYGQPQQDIVAQEFQKLTPAFEDLAYQKEQDFLNRQLKLADVAMQWDTLQANRQMDDFELIKLKADFIMKMEQRDFEHFSVQLRQRRKGMEIELERQRQQLERTKVENEIAYKRIDYLGYADNESAATLGIEPGTEARWIKEIELKQKKDLETMSKQHQYNMKMLELNKKVEMELEKSKAKVDLESSLALMKSQFGYDASLQARKSEMDREIYKIKKAQEEARIKAAEAKAAAKAAAKEKEQALKDQQQVEFTYVHNLFKNKFVKNGVLKSNLSKYDKDYYTSAESDAADFLIQMKSDGISDAVINKIQAMYGISSQSFSYTPPSYQYSSGIPVKNDDNIDSPLYNFWSYMQSNYGITR